METEAPDGYRVGNGQCSPRKENSRMLVDLSSASAPNGQASPQGPKSPAEPSIKQEQEEEEEEEEEEADRSSTAAEDALHSGEEGSGLEEPMTDSPGNLQDDGTSSGGRDAGGGDTGSRIPNGDRPFQCNQCGVSFTQKGNLLRHVKLHTGEKPFKCPFCNYACRRRDALTGHLRTHAVGKPHKCNYCGRSYKQRTSLEEHKERCHSYLQSVGMEPAANATGPYSSGEGPKEPRPLAEPSAMSTYDRPPVIERLQSQSVGKRKSTTPQKFVGEKMVRYTYPEMNYELGLKYEKEAELMQAHMMDQAISNAITYLGSENLVRPLVPGHHPGAHHPLSMAEVVPMVNPLFHHVLPLHAGHRLEPRPPGNHIAPPPPLPPQQQNHQHQHQPPSLPPPPPPHPDFPGHRPTSNGPPAGDTSLSKHGRHHGPHAARGESPNNNSGPDSADSARSSPQERHGGGGYHGNHIPPPPGHPRSRAPSGGGRAVAPPEVIRTARERPPPHNGLDGLRVFGGREGGELRAFQCEHCRVLFLDHVMYTIHMGCHGYRDPLECNICGHRSKDRYEFSSHIVRGEHTFH